ncbi:MAG: magnesium transporter, partial [Lentisphaerae bacterium]|nr:magnesium transporter [Lentisphaerota bacterium]
MTRHQKPETDILDLIRREEWDRVATAIRGLHPADIADVLESAPHDDLERLFSLVDDEIKPDVLAELTSVAGAEILDSLTSPEISGIVEEMAPDDAADVLGDLPGDRSTEVLQLMSAEESEDVRELMQYEDDTAGGIMTTDVVAMRENQTVEEALGAIADMDTHEPFYYANLVDEGGRLIGYVDIWELLREKDRQRRLADIAHRDAISATVEMDQEQVAMLMTRYDVDAIPVVDDAGKLVGRITSDDVFDVIEEEASE